MSVPVLAEGAAPLIVEIRWSKRKIISLSTSRARSGSVRQSRPSGGRRTCPRPAVAGAALIGRSALRPDQSLDATHRYRPERFRICAQASVDAAFSTGPNVRPVRKVLRIWRLATHIPAAPRTTRRTGHPQRCRLIRSHTNHRSRNDKYKWPGRHALSPAYSERGREKMPGR